jgi:hypothetical protein
MTLVLRIATQPFCVVRSDAPTTGMSILGAWQPCHVGKRGEVGKTSKSLESTTWNSKRVQQWLIASGTAAGGLAALLALVWRVFG